MQGGLRDTLAGGGATCVPRAAPQPPGIVGIYWQTPMWSRALTNHECCRRADERSELNGLVHHLLVEAREGIPYWPHAASHRQVALSPPQWRRRGLGSPCGPEAQRPRAGDVRAVLWRDSMRFQVIDRACRPRSEPSRAGLQRQSGRPLTRRAIRASTPECRGVAARLRQRILGPGSVARLFPYRHATVAGEPVWPGDPHDHPPRLHAAP